eukprot:Nk52_evm35s745 gene=Nk52_evmTU35s745
MEKVRTNLHVSFVPETLPCREDEFLDIYQFLEGKIRQQTGGCMYICGMPGTGKTATTTEVVRKLNELSDEDNWFPKFQYVAINGMKLTDPRQSYVEVWRALTGKTATPSHASQMLEEGFSRKKNHGVVFSRPIVLLIDELDVLVTRKQDVMYNFLHWPNVPKSKLIVVAIANTMDLPERALASKISSRLGVTRMTFEPYTHKQLLTIIKSRLGGLDSFEDNAVQLCSRKIAAVSGDARRALDICRRATEIADIMHAQRLKEEKEAGKRATKIEPKVGMDEIDAALKEIFSSPSIQYIRAASLHEKIFLSALLLEFKSSGVEESIFGNVFSRHVTLCRLYGMSPPSPSDISRVCGRLGASRLILAENSTNDLHQRIRLNINENDVVFSLRSDDLCKKILTNYS